MSDRARGSVEVCFRSVTCKTILTVHLGARHVYTSYDTSVHPSVVDNVCGSGLVLDTLPETTKTMLHVLQTGSELRPRSNKRFQAVILYDHRMQVASKMEICILGAL